MTDLKQIREMDELLDKIYEENKSGPLFDLMRCFNPSQIRNIENIAYSSTNISSIKNYIKNQTGKDKNKDWSKVESNISPDCFGTLLLKKIEEVEKLAAEKYDTLDFKLRVIRGFIHQLVSQFLYQGNTK